MVRVKITALTDLNNESFDTQSLLILSLLDNTTVPQFANPPIPIPNLTSDVDKYHTLMLLAKSKASLAIKQRNDQRVILTRIWNEIAEWAAFQVRNESNAAELLQSIGFVPTKEGRTPVHEIGIPQGIVTEPSEEPGGIDLIFEAVPNAQCYAIEISEQADGPDTVYRNYGFSTKVRTLVAGLERGKFYTIRVRAYHGSVGYSMPSETTRCMAG